MTKQEIIEKITALAVSHQSPDEINEDDRDTEYLEQEAFDLITQYCETAGYQINGFPKDKKKQAEEDLDLDEDYFCADRYRYYVDMLTLEKEDVADLNWHYYSSFWPAQFEDRDDFISTVKGWIKSGENFYGVNI
ncbi:MAG: hypothetical protein ACK5AO_04435 [bacterium]|jgi:uncharacterized Rmd1/YagE family protein